MNRVVTTSLFSLLAMWIVGDIASAQQRTTDTGSFGSRTLGGGISQPQQGLSGRGGFRGNQGAGAGTGTLGQQQRGGLGQRRTGFIGADRADVAEFVGGMRDLAANNTAATTESGDDNRNRRADRNRGQAPQRTMIRVQYRAAFPYPELNAAVLGRQLRDDVSALNRVRQAGGYTAGTVAVSLERRTATLHGAVASEYDRLVAERLALLEPGVTDVENRLIVVPSSEDASAAPSTN